MRSVDSLTIAYDLIGSASLLVAGTKLYEYALAKSLDKGGAPGGWVGHRKANKRLTWKFRHGVVQYKRPLKQDTIYQYRLEPLTPKDPEFLRQMLSLVYDDIARSMIMVGNYEHDVKGGNVARVGNDPTSPKHVYLLEIFDRAGNPVGKGKRFKERMQAAAELWKHFTPKKQQTYIDVISFDI